MQYTKFYNARAEPLFCSLNLLFYQVLVAVAVAVVVCVKSLLPAIKVKRNGLFLLWYNNDIKKEVISSRSFAHIAFPLLSCFAYLGFLPLDLSRVRL